MAITMAEVPATRAVGVRSGRSWRVGTFLVALTGYALCLFLVPVVSWFSGTRHGATLNVNLWMILPTFPLLASLTTRSLREVRVVDGAVELEERDGTVLRFGLAEVGGIGYRGTTVLGRLVHGPSGWGSLNGAVVLVDPWGRQLAARAGGFFSVRALRDLCGRTGVRWVDACLPSVPLVPQPLPAFEEVPPALGRPALEDPLTAAALRAQRRRRRRTLAAYAATFALGWVAAATYDSFPDRSIATVALATLAWICLPVGFLLLVLAPLNERRPRRYRRALAEGSWVLAEAVALDGRGSDKSVRVVGICLADSPDRTLPPEWWRARAGGGRGWLAPGARHWVWLARSADGTEAVLAPLDRQDFAALAVDAKARTAADVAIAEFRAAGVALGLIAPEPLLPPSAAWPPPAAPSPGWPPPTGPATTPPGAGSPWRPVP